jgi:hypothetical protein
MATHALTMEPVGEVVEPVVPVQRQDPPPAPRPEAVVPIQAAEAVQVEAAQVEAVRPDGLSERDRAVLLFEKQYWKYSGAKEQAIRDRFGMSATRYYQVLNALLDRAEAQEFEPAVVKRLRRQRAARQRARSGASQLRVAHAGG